MTFRFLLYSLLILSGAIIGTVNWKKLAVPFKILTVLLLYSFFSEMLSRALIFYFKTSFPVYHFYVIISTILYLFIFFTQYNSQIKKIIVSIFAIAFVLFSAINSIFFQGIFTFPSKSIIVSDLLIVIFSFLLFTEILKQEKNQTSKYLIWLNSSVLIYFTMQLFNWGLYDYLLDKKYNTKILSVVGYIINICYYFSLFIFTYLSKKKISFDE